MIEDSNRPRLLLEETGSVSRDIPGIGFSAQSSTAPNHTYEMDADNLKPISHNGFTIDAQAMAALLFDFATDAPYRAAVISAILQSFKLHMIPPHLIKINSQ